MIKIYTITNCSFCAELKELLKTENIEFIDVNVDLDENEAEYNEINRISQSDDVPIIKVGKQLLVPNISFQSIKEGVYLIIKLLSESDTPSK